MVRDTEAGSQLDNLPLGDLREWGVEGDRPIGPKGQGPASSLEELWATVWVDRMVSRMGSDGDLRVPVPLCNCSSEGNEHEVPPRDNGLLDTLDCIRTARSRVSPGQR